MISFHNMFNLLQTDNKSTIIPPPPNPPPPPPKKNILNCVYSVYAWSKDLGGGVNDKK